MRKKGETLTWHEKTTAFPEKKAVGCSGACPADWAVYPRPSGRGYTWNYGITGATVTEATLSYFSSRWMTPLSSGVTVETVVVPSAVMTTTL